MSSAPQPAQASGMKRPRDVRLDFARGLSMFIIFVAHVPANSWFLFIPARFGFSSAAEMFVFCSGLASGYAFGGTFVKKGFGEGTRRVGKRVAQVYGAHLGLITGLTAASFAGMALLGNDYPERLGLGPLFAPDGSGLLATAFLQFMPPYSDILPLYIILLAMIPAAMAVGWLSPSFVMPASAALWLIANLAGLNLPANGGEWFFNPFAWQLLFVAGFSFAMDWLPVPVLKRGLLFWICAAAVLISIPLNFWPILEAFPALNEFRDFLLPPGNQTYLSPFRAGHFLMLAYVLLVLVDPYRSSLARAKPIILVGQQSLPTFITSTTLIWVAGMALDWTGRDQASTAAVNLAGFGIIIAVAYASDFLKQKIRNKAKQPTPAVQTVSRPVTP